MKILVVQDTSNNIAFIYDLRAVGTQVSPVGPLDRWTCGPEFEVELWYELGDGVKSVFKAGRFMTREAAVEYQTHIQLGLLKWSKGGVQNSLGGALPEGFEHPNDVLDQNRLLPDKEHPQKLREAEMEMEMEEITEVAYRLILRDIRKRTELHELMESTSDEVKADIERNWKRAIEDAIS